MEENQVPEEGKQDIVDRKGAWLERMFDRLFSAVVASPTAAILVLSVALNFWQFSINEHINELRLADKDASKEEIINEVRRTVDRELPKKMAPIQAKQDSISKNVDTSLYNLNGTVESVKQYIKKKTR